MQEENHSTSNNSQNQTPEGLAQNLPVEKEIDLNALFPGEETDLNALFPDGEMKHLLKKISKNKKDLVSITQNFTVEETDAEGGAE